jgi:hypothetical protein
MIPVEASEGRMHATFIAGPRDGLETPVKRPDLVPPIVFFYTTCIHPVKVHVYVRDDRGGQIIFWYAGVSDPKKAVETVIAARERRNRKPEGGPGRDANP